MIMDLATAYLTAYRDVQEANQRNAELQQRKVEAAQRAQQAQQELAQTMAIRQQQMQQETQVEQQRINVQAKMQQQRIDLENQALNEKRQEAAARAKEAADGIAQTRGFYAAIAGGMPTAEAAWRFPKARQGAINESGTSERSAERMAQKRQEDQDKVYQNFAKETENRRKSEVKQQDTKAKLQAKEDAAPPVSVKLPGDQGSIRLPANSPQINALLGDQAPAGLGTNWQGGATSPNVPQGKQFKEGQTIRNKKDGKLYVVKDGQPVPLEEEE